MASRRMTSRGVRRAAFVACALMVHSPLFGAGDPDATGGSSVAPNQSVALTVEDGRAPDTARPPAGAGDRVDGSSQSPQGDGAPGARPKPRLLRRRDADAVATRGLTNEVTPWHRSGLGALAIVLALVVVVFFVVRRYVPSMRVNEHGAIRVVARTALSPKHSVALLRLGQRFVLVGVTGDRLTALAEVRDADEVGELAAQVGVSGAGEGFAGTLAAESLSFEPELEEASPDQGGASDKAAPGRSARGGGLAQLKRRLSSLQSK